MPVTLKQEVKVTETLDMDEVVVTEPIIVVRPPEPPEIITITKTVGNNVMAEAIAIILLLLLAYGVYRLLMFLIPYIIGLSLVVCVGYFGYLLL